MVSSNYVLLPKVMASKNQPLIKSLSKRRALKRFQKFSHTLWPASSVKRAQAYALLNEPIISEKQG